MSRSIIGIDAETAEILRVHRERTTQLAREFGSIPTVTPTVDRNTFLHEVVAVVEQVAEQVGVKLQ